MRNPKRSNGKEGGIGKLRGLLAPVPHRHAYGNVAGFCAGSGSHLCSDLQIRLQVAEQIPHLLRLKELEQPFRHQRCG